MFFCAGKSGGLDDALVREDYLRSWGVQRCDVGVESVMNARKVQSIHDSEAVDVRNMVQAVNSVREVMWRERSTEEAFVFDGGEGGERVSRCGRDKLVFAVRFTPELDSGILVATYMSNKRPQRLALIQIFSVTPSNCANTINDANAIQVQYDLNHPHISASTSFSVNRKK